MRTLSFAFPALCILATACSDYNVQGIPKAEVGGDDTAAPDDESEGEDAPEETEDDCTESSTAFDIEEVSSLQDAFGLPNVRDGLMLSLEPGSLEDGRTWRPATVQVLVMYPEWYFDYYDDSNALTVHFYPAATPQGGAVFSKRIRIRKGGLEWAPLTLPSDADWSGDDLDQVAAWLEFDLRDTVPEGGFTTTDYFVSLEWDSMGFPNVGYSNFELNCAQNWTDYGSGSYVENSGQDCSWPMLKIEIETVLDGDCE